LEGTEFLVDAGQSAIKIRSLVGHALTTSSHSFVDTARPITPQIASAIREFCEHTGHTPWRISISSTALTHPERTAGEILDQVLSLGVTTILLAHDAIGGYLSTLGDEYGAVSAVGTGVVTLGVGHSGVARVDGWGNIIGDAGSGYWIGRKALDAAMRSYDGRGEPTVLLDFMSSEFENVEEAYIELQADPSRVSRVASFARTTIDTAATDNVAAEIVLLAAKEIVASLDAALRRVGFLPEEDPSIGWTGSVATNPYFTEILRGLLGSSWPHAVLRDPVEDSLQGIEKMANLPAGHPLRSHIARASSL
jgi:glucosamine kinase